MRRGNQMVCNSGVACLVRSVTALFVNVLHNANERLAEFQISNKTVVIRRGSPWPPKAILAEAFPHPASW